MIDETKQNGDEDWYDDDSAFDQALKTDIKKGKG